CRRISVWHDGTARIVWYELADTADVGRDDGESAGHRLEHSVRRIVEVRRQREDVGGPVIRGRLALWKRPDERHGVADTERDRPRPYALPLRAVADDEQVHVADAMADERHRLDEELNVLDRHEPGNCDDDAPILETERRALARPVGTEGVGVHTLRDAMNR